MANNLVSVKIGGKLIGNTTDLGDNALLGFFIIILLLILKAFLVRYTYNTIAPKLIANAGGDVNNFRELDFVEALLFIILVHSLLL
jgi:hypothetical protein